MREWLIVWVVVLSHKRISRVPRSIWVALQQIVTDHIAGGASTANLDLHLAFEAHRPHRHLSQSHRNWIYDRMSVVDNGMGGRQVASVCIVAILRFFADLCENIRV